MKYCTTIGTTTFYICSSIQKQFYNINVPGLYSIQEGSFIVITFRFNINPNIQNFEASCFDGNYVTGDITESYLDALEAARNTSAAKADRQRDSSDFARSQLHLHLATED